MHELLGSITIDDIINFLFREPHTSTNIINLSALIAFIVETIIIIFFKFTNINTFPRWKYLDFFLRKNISTLITIRAALFVSSFAIYLPKDNIDYRLFSVIYLCYLLIFCITCGWAYAYHKGYLDDDIS